MKKIFMMALIATAALTANAQDVKNTRDSKDNTGVEMQARKGRAGHQRFEQSKPRKDLTPEQFADLRLKRMERLNLSDSQKSKLKSIYMDEAKKKKAHREDMRKMDSDFQKRVDNVLNDEQKAKYNNMKGKRPRQQQGRCGNGCKRNMKKACPLNK